MFIKCIGDASSLPMKSESVHLVVTSPPFYKLRKYAGNQARAWDGHRGCNHEWYNLTSGKPDAGDLCVSCGAWKGELGQEPEPDDFIRHLSQVMREVKRVLRKDGVAFVELGTSYRNQRDLGIPARFHLAMLKDGWIVRSVIIWAKSVSFNERPGIKDLVTEWADKIMPIKVDTAPLITALEEELEKCLFRGSCIPEPVHNRPTQSWTPVYMLTKNASAWADTREILEPHALSSLKRYEYGLHNKAPDDGLIKAGARKGIFNSDRTGDFIDPNGKNPRSVWCMPGIVLEPAYGTYSGGHFASFPPKMVENFILMASPVFVCRKCGTGYSKKRTRGDQVTSEPWIPACSCYPEMQEQERPKTYSTVLDPFAGSGSTGVAASTLSRHAVCIDLSREYVEEDMTKRVTDFQIAMHL
jgi:site-specific DNA-methyltransferase (adenine-specific)